MLLGSYDVTLCSVVLQRSLAHMMWLSVLYPCSFLPPASTLPSARRPWIHIQPGWEWRPLWPFWHSHPKPLTPEICCEGLVNSCLTTSKTQKGIFFTFLKKGTARKMHLFLDYSCTINWQNSFVCSPFFLFFPPCFFTILWRRGGPCDCASRNTGVRSPPLCFKDDEQAKWPWYSHMLFESPERRRNMLCMLQESTAKVLKSYLSACGRLTVRSCSPALVLPWGGSWSQLYFW